MVFSKYRTGVFVNGCFWHKHEGCRYYVPPKSSRDFWDNKLERNRQRDIANMEKLKNKGWNVIVVWECELKKDAIEKRLELLYKKSPAQHNQAPKCTAKQI